MSVPSSRDGVSEIGHKIHLCVLGDGQPLRPKISLCQQARHSCGEMHFTGMHMVCAITNSPAGTAHVNVNSVLEIMVLSTEGKAIFVN